MKLDIELIKWLCMAIDCPNIQLTIENNTILIEFHILAKGTHI